MIIPIKNYRSRLSIIHNIPKTFFTEIDRSIVFGDHLFPKWSINVFNATSMQLKFKAVYDNYKALPTDIERKIVLDFFVNTNKIQELCENEPVGIQIYIIDHLPASIRESIKILFSHLYDNALEYRKFEEYVKTSVKKDINQFLQINKIQVCPFCGIETYLNLEGQARLPLDHWLDKSKFPVASVNHKNLIPIGPICNGPGVKHDKNILLNGINRRFTKVYYPFLKNLDINIKFKFINEPSSINIPDEDWEIEIIPANNFDQIYIESWDWIMNLNSRYRSYFKHNIFPLWEDTYREYTEDPDNALTKANNIDEFKINLRQWKGSFKIKGQPGAILYRAFIDYLLTDATEEYLFGLCENFKR
jgi:hypothetical protein